MAIKHRKLFDRLDTDHDGRISLIDIVESNDETVFKDATSTRSLFLLRKFDHNEDGHLTYDEFVEFCKELHRSRGGIFSCFNRRSEEHPRGLRSRRSQDSEPDGSDRVWRTYIAEEAGDSDAGGSRMFTSFFSGAQLSDSTVNLIRFATNSDTYTSTRIARNASEVRVLAAARAAAAAAHTHSRSPSVHNSTANHSTAHSERQSVEEDASINAAGDAAPPSAPPSAPTVDAPMTIDAIDIPQSETQLSLLNDLDTEDGRRHFLDWLFTVTDCDRNGKVSSVELGALLDALAEDGIPGEALTYIVADDAPEISRLSQVGRDSVEGRKHLAERIIRDFDTDTDQFLDAEEFREFATVLANELLSQREWLGKNIRRVGPYILSRTIGYGGEGLVKHGVHSTNGRAVAFKIVPRGNLSQLGRVDAEIEALHTLRKAPTVLDIYEVFESSEYVFIAIELCGGGTLHDFIRAHPRVLSEDVARYFFVSVASALASAHAAGVVHRDVRIENVLLSNGGAAKLGDWGHSARFRRGWDLFNDPPGTIGSLHSASPEMLRPGPYSGVKADAWGLGVLLFCLLTRQRPFKGADCAEVLSNIQKYETAPIPSTVSSSARMLLARLMHPDPAARITPADALTDPWVTAGRLLKPAIALGVIRIPEQIIAEGMSGAWTDAVGVLRELGTVHILQRGQGGQRVVRLDPCGGSMTIPASTPVEGASLPAYAAEDAAFATVDGTSVILEQLSARTGSTSFSMALSDDGSIRLALTAGTTWDFRRLYMRVRNRLSDIWEDEADSDIVLMEAEVGDGAELHHRVVAEQHSLA